MVLQQIPTDNIRLILRYLTIQDTWNLYQASGHTRKTFNRSIKSICLPRKRQNLMMWLRLECDNRVYDMNRKSYNPYQYVPVKLQFRGDLVYVSATCPCCDFKSSFKFNNVALVKKLLDKDLKPTPFYVSQDLIFAGHYQCVPESELRPGNIVEVLQETHLHFGPYCRWVQAIITSINNTHIVVRYLGFDHVESIHKLSPRLAKHRTHIDPPQNHMTRMYMSTPLTKSRWSTHGQPVYLLKASRFDLQLVDDTK